MNEAVVLNLDEELKKGQKRIALASLFESQHPKAVDIDDLWQLSIGGQGR